MRHCLNTYQAIESSYSSDYYLLLDGLKIDVPVRAFTLDEHPKIEPLYRGTRHASLLEASPWLVKPTAAGRLLTEHSAWREHGLLLRSSASIEVLAAHLRSLLSVRLPSQQLAYCRFHNPDWASRLFSAMTIEEFSAWSGPVQEWLIHTDGTWHSYTNTLTSPYRKADEEGWYSLREEQLQHWQNEEHQRFIDRAAQHLGCANHQPEYSQQCARIEQLIQQAYEYGFTMEYQILHFLELAWRFPEALSSPGWKQHFANHAQDADLRLRFAEERLFGLEGNA